MGPGLRRDDGKNKEHRSIRPCSELSWSCRFLLPLGVRSPAFRPAATYATNALRSPAGRGIWHTSRAGL
jgi:hypothetical protein